MIDLRCARWIGGLLALVVALPGHASSFNTSFFFRLTADDGEVFELQSRQVLAAGRFVEEKGSNWGIAFAIDEHDGDGTDSYQLTLRVMKKVPEDDGHVWQERAGTVGAGGIDTPFDINLRGEGVEVESNFFVSRVPR